MIRSEHVVMINAPVDTVFTTVTDIERSPQWVSVLKSVRLASDSAVGVGTTFTEYSEIAGQHAVIDKVVTAYDPPRTYAVKSTAGPVAHAMTLTLEPVANSTKLTLLLEAEEPVGIMGVLGGIVVAMVRDQLNGDLARLKKLIEQR